MSDNTNTKRQIEALPGVHYRRATLSDCDNILALDPTFLSGMDYMHFRLAHYINDPNCVCGVMVTADDTVVAFHVFRIADEGRAVYAGGLRVRADHRRQGYPAILSSNSESIVKDITRLWGRQPIVGRLTVAESPWITDYIAKNPTRNVVDRRIVAVVETGQQSLINLLSSPDSLAKQYVFNDVIKLTSSSHAYDVMSRNQHLLSCDVFCCLLEPYQLLKFNIDYLTTVMNAVIMATPLAASATGWRNDGVAAGARCDVSGISTNVTFPCTAGIRHDFAYYGTPDADVIVQQLLYALANSDKIMSRASNDSKTPVFIWLLLPDDIECRMDVINILCNQLGFSMPRGDGVKYLLVVEFPFENFASKL